MTTERVSTAAATRLIAAARRAHSAVDGLDSAFAQLLGIGRTDLRCINLLEFCPLAPGEIARRLELASASVTALIDRLETAGLARRVPSAEDRRSLVVELQPRAYASVGSFYRRFAEALIASADTLGADGRGRVAEALEHMAAAAEAVAADAGSSKD